MRRLISCMALLLAMAAIGQAQICLSNIPTTSMCSNVLEYGTAQVQIATGCVATTERSISSVKLLLGASNFTDSCRQAVSYLACTASYLRCNAGSISQTCSSFQTTVTSSCSQLELGLLQGAGVNFTAMYGALSSAGCTAAPTTLTAPGLAKCQTATSAICRGINHPVYISETTPLSAMEASLKKLEDLSWVAIPNAPQCRDVFSKFACSLVYRECDDDAFRRTTGVNLRVPFARFPCRATCNLFNQCFGPLIATLPPADAAQFNCSLSGSFVPASVDCTGAVISPPQDNFPAASTTIGSFQIPCQDYSATTAPTYVASGAGNGTWVPVIPGTAYPPTFLPVSAINATVLPIPVTSFCASVLPYNTSLVPVSTCPKVLDAQISSLATLLSADAFSEDCRKAAGYLLCSRIFTRSNALYPCQGDCQAALTSCSTDALKLLYGNGLNLNGAICPSLPANGHPLCASRNVAEPLRAPVLPTCQMFQSRICVGVNYPVYVPAGGSLAALETLAVSKMTAAVFPTGPYNSPCQDALARFVCSQVFRRCDYDALRRATAALPVSRQLNISLPLPRFPCQYQCQDFQTKCAPLIARIPDLQAISCNQSTVLVAGTDCSGSVVIRPGQPDFPDAVTKFSDTLATPCQNFSDTPTISRFGPPPQALTWVNPATPTAVYNGSTAALTPLDFCAAVLPYKLGVFVPAGQTVKDLNNIISLVPTILSVGAVSNTCRAAVSYLLCARVFPPAGTNKFLPCQEDCSPILFGPGGTAGACNTIDLGLLGAAGVNFYTSICPSLPTNSSGNCFLRGQAAVAPVLPKCERFKSDFCKGVDYDVYVPVGLSTAALEATARTYQLLFNLNLDPCRQVVQRYICSRVFLGCDTTALTSAGLPYGPVPLPRLPCRSHCEALSQCYARCQTSSPGDAICLTFKSNPTLIPNCTSAGFYLNGQPDFPVQKTVFATLAGAELSTQCNDLSQPAATNPASTTFNELAVDVKCPYPMIIPDRPENAVRNERVALACALPCPNIIYTDEEWVAATTIMKVFGSISTAGTVFITLTWAIFPAKANQRHILWFAVCLAVTSTIMLAGNHASGYDLKKVGCKDNSSGVLQKDGGYCVLEHIVIIYFVNAGVLWWFWIDFNLFWRVWTGKKSFGNAFLDNWKELIFHLISWSVPLIYIIILLAVDAAGGDGNVPWCFGSPTAPKWVGYALFYFPVAIVLLTGSVLMSITMGFLLVTTLKTGGTKNKGWYLQFVRPLTFVFGYLFTFLLLLQFRAVVFQKEDDTKKAIETIVGCLYTPTGSAATCGDHASVRPTLASWILTCMACGGCGLAALAVYGTQGENFTLWLNLLRGKGLNAAQGQGLYGSKSGASKDVSQSGGGAGSGGKKAGSSGKAGASASTKKSSGAASGSAEAPSKSAKKEGSVEIDLSTIPPAAAGAGGDAVAPSSINPTVL